MASQSGGGFQMPANAHEWLSLLAAVLGVIALVQIGAPLVRELDFIDPKLRDAMIGVSFVAFPFIHAQCKRGVALFASAPPVRADLTPWYVTGAIAAALLFALNQFVSLCAGFAIGVFHGLINAPEVSDQVFMQAVTTSLLAMSLPMSALASVFAGFLLNRMTRSHVFAALAIAGLLYLTFNVALNYALQPAFIAEKIQEAMAGGAETMIGFLIGMGLVAFIVLVFGAIGIVISRVMRERSLGLIVDQARRLSVPEREVLAAELSQRLRAPAPLPQQMPAAAEP